MVAVGVGRTGRRTVVPPRRARSELALPEEWSRSARPRPMQQRVTWVQSNIAKVLDHLNDEQQSRGTQGCYGEADAN
jgi:hypothetical protein